MGVQLSTEVSQRQQHDQLLHEAALRTSAPQNSSSGQLAGASATPVSGAGGGETATAPPGTAPDTCCTSNAHVCQESKVIAADKQPVTVPLAATATPSSADSAPASAAAPEQKKEPQEAGAVQNKVHDVKAASVPPAKAACLTARHLVSSPDGKVELVRDVFEHIAREFFRGTLLTRADKIPYDMRPRRCEGENGCCVHKDRAMIKYKCMAALGIRVETVDDDSTTIAELAEVAMKRTREDVRGPALTVIEEACNHCNGQNYFVTDACQGCVAHPCSTNCPKKAISHVRGRAVIDTSSCIKCGKCMQLCPYHAITFIPIPCVAACPVGAIEGMPDGRKIFHWDKCIYCGACQRACPFGAVMERSQLLDVLRVLTNPTARAVALVAPAAAGHFGNATMWTLADGLRQAGFAEVVEVSIGADEVAREEAAEFAERFGPNAAHPSKLPFMTTSCCPAYINCVRKHVPEIEDAVSHTPTPMHVAARDAKKRWPGCMAVFIGPCVAKLQEAVHDEFTDYALTFSETLGLLRARDVVLNATANPPPAGYEAGCSQGRGFAVAGGVAGAVMTFVDGVKPYQIDGLTPKAVASMHSWVRNPPPGNLVEVMACEGGCIAGPGCVTTSQVARARVKMLVSKSQNHPDALKQQPPPAPAPK